MKSSNAWIFKVVEKLQEKQVSLQLFFLWMMYWLHRTMNSFLNLSCQILVPPLTPLIMTSSHWDSNISLVSKKPMLASLGQNYWGTLHKYSLLCRWCPVLSIYQSSQTKPISWLYFRHEIWMTCNFLLLNSGIIAIIALGHERLWNLLSKDIVALDLASSSIIRNLEVIFDQDMLFNCCIKQTLRMRLFA